MRTDFKANNTFHKQKKAVNKRMLFPLEKNSDCTSQNDVFVEKIRFHPAEKLFSPAGISKNSHRKCLLLSRLLYKIWLDLNLNIVFHEQKIRSEYKTTRQKIRSHLPE